MDAGDDELDKLIQETQDIWKSLKHSGIEIKNSDIEDPTNADTKLDDLDEIATKLENSTLNIIHTADNTLANMTNMTHSNISNINVTNVTDDRSRTLAGLNLATPQNELSSLLMSEEPSKLSQIRFSTPNIKKTNAQNNSSNRDISSALPDTPFLFSPSLPRHDIPNDLTLSSPINSSNVNHTKETKKEINPIDFNEECWYSINQMLSKSGFSVLMKQHNEKYEEISPQIIICNRFTEILNKYDTLRKDALEHDILKKREKDLNLQNKELKNQLRISSEKMSDLKKEMSAMKREKTQIDNKNDDMLINVKRQLDHCKNIIQKKNDEITKIKQKLQEHIQKDTVRRESVEAVFQSINKRKVRKNNKKDQQQMDVMEMYEEERKKMQNEVKFLRKELRNVNQKWIKQKDQENEAKVKQNKQNKKKKKQSWNVSFTPSKTQSDDEDDDDDDDDDDGDDDDDEVVTNLKWKTRNEIKKQIKNMDDIERANDLNRLETQKLREKLDEIYREKEEVENNLCESKKEVKTLSTELEKRPSYNEWTRLRKELSTMNKQLMETKKVASLRKYMDTRELIKRDKQIHSLNLTQIDALPTEIMKEILQDLCRILSIKDVTVLVESVRKVTKCVECVPILEQYISKIVRVLMASDHAPQLVKISKIAPKSIFDRVVPILKQWIIDLDKVAALTTFRAKIDTILGKRTIYKNNLQNTESHLKQLQLHEIVKQIEELVESEEYLLNSKECFQSAQKQIISNPDDLCNRIIRHFQHIFSIQSIEGVFPKMNQIYLELNEMRNVLKTIKSILGLPQNCAVNICFKELQKFVEQRSESDVTHQVKEAVDGNKENKARNPSVITKWNDILMEIQTVLQCKNEDEIVLQCKELIDRCKEYDAVFPRVHNLVNQLRSTLNVEYAHQILPKVKELVANA